MPPQESQNLQIAGMTPQERAALFARLRDAPNNAARRMSDGRLLAPHAPERCEHRNNTSQICPQSFSRGDCCRWLPLPSLQPIPSVRSGREILGE